MEPLSPYNVVNETMQAVNKALLERGLFTMIRFNGIMTNPPLCITEEQLEDGFAIIDEALEIADARGRPDSDREALDGGPALGPRREAVDHRRRGPALGRSGRTRSAPASRGSRLR